MKRKEGDQWLPPERDAELVLALRSYCICFSSKSISFMLKFLNTITHRRQKTPPIIRLVMRLAEKMSDLLIMYCSKNILLLHGANLATDAGSPDILMREDCMELAARVEKRIH
jgi:hypothetical protein